MAQKKATPAKPAAPKKSVKAAPATPKAKMTAGPSAKITALEPFFASPAGKTLTTNQGLPIADDQNSLRAGERGPTLLEDFILREKITHFDHERIPERVVSCARRSRPRLFSSVRIDGAVHESRLSARPFDSDARVRALLDGWRLTWFG